jgi:hypothetical protein
VADVEKPAATAFPVPEGDVRRECASTAGPVRALLVDGTIIRVRALTRPSAARGRVLLAAPVRDRYLRFFSAGVLRNGGHHSRSRGPTDVSLGPSAARH